MKHGQRVVRATFMWVLFILIVIFYLPVCAAIQALVSVDSFSQWAPGISVLMDIPFISQVIRGIVPGKLSNLNHTLNPKR